VVAGLAGVAEIGAGAGQAVLRAVLLQAVAQLDGEGEGLGVLTHGAGRVAQRAGGRARAVRFPGDFLASRMPAHADWDTCMPERLHLARTRQPQLGPVQMWLTRRLRRGLYTNMRASWPDGIRELLIERHLSPEWLRVGVQDFPARIPRGQVTLVEPSPEPNAPEAGSRKRPSRQQRKRARGGPARS
jgi:hypothetical protein